MAIHICAELEWKWTKIIRKIKKSRLRPQPFGKFVEHAIGKHDAILYKSGATKTRAAAACQFAIDKWHPDAVINLGTCGGVAENIAKRTIVVAKKTFQYDVLEKFGKPSSRFSPGHLPDNLTVEKIRAGNSNIRNPILVSHIAKGILPYRGLASGIQRALEAWPKIEFSDDREGCLFKATILRTAPELQSGLEETAGEGAGKVTPERKSRLESALAARVLSLLSDVEQGKASLASHLGHKTVSGELHKQVRRLLDLCLIEMTNPEKPKSRLQKYRLTETGRSLLVEAGDGEHK